MLLSSRRSLLGTLLFAPTIIGTPGILMSVSSILQRQVEDPSGLNSIKTIFIQYSGMMDPENIIDFARLNDEHLDVLTSTEENPNPKTTTHCRGMQPCIQIVEEVPYKPKEFSLYLEDMIEWCKDTPINVTIGRLPN